MLAFAKPQIRFCPLAVYPDLAGPQEFFQRPVFQARVVPPEPAVQPDVVVVRGYIGCLDIAHTAMFRTNDSPANIPPTANKTDEAT